MWRYALPSILLDHATRELWDYVYVCPVSQELKTNGGPPAIAGALQKVKAEAERLDVTDKAAGVLAELLYSEKLLMQIKEYRPIMLHVRN